MKQEQFESLYQQVWDDFDALLKALESSKARKKKDQWSAAQKDFPHNYRRICNHLALAKERRYTTGLVSRLNHLVLRGHQELYKRKTNFLQYIIQFVLAEFPCLLRQHKQLFWASTAFFYLPGLLIFILVLLFPELIYNVMNPAQVTDFEDMYNPALEKLGRLRQSDTDMYMFGYYISHNIGIAFQTFAAGLLFVAGTLFYLIFNGLIFGALSAHIVNLEYQDTFFTFVIGHCSFELTAITIAGAAGIKIGMSIISPGNLKRLDSLRADSKVAIKLVSGAGLMLVAAAFVEAFWSSSSGLEPWIKYSVGAVLWVFVIVYLTFAGRGTYFESQ